MDTNKRGKPLIYDRAFKIAIAREYLTSDLGYGALAKKYNLPLAKTVDYFVKWYKKNYTEEVQQPCTTEDSLSGSLNSTEVSKQLKEANLKIAGLEMLIETAREELGIDIVKKPGTKQL
jgi:transposase-like protein